MYSHFYFHLKRDWPQGAFFPSRTIKRLLRYLRLSAWLKAGMLLSIEIMGNFSLFIILQIKNPKFNSGCCRSAIAKLCFWPQIEILGSAKVNLSQLKKFI